MEACATARISHIEGNKPIRVYYGGQPHDSNDSMELEGSPPPAARRTAKERIKNAQQD
jgi:hypothetical protein